MEEKDTSLKFVNKMMSVGKKKEDTLIKNLKQVEGVSTINVIQSNTDTMG